MFGSDDDAIAFLSVGAGKLFIPLILPIRSLSLRLNPLFDLLLVIYLIHRLLYKKISVKSVLNQGLSIIISLTQNEAHYLCN